MHILQRLLTRFWRPALLVVTLGVAAYALYFYHLGTLLPGYAASEAATYHGSQTWQALLHNPLNAPYKLLLLALLISGHHNLLATRMAAAICSLAAVIIFFCVARAWYGFRVGFLGTLLFATSAGFLHTARFGTPQILQMGVLAIIGILLWHRRAPAARTFLTYAVVLVFGVLLYVPGMIWFELAALAVVHRRALKHWRQAAIVHRVLWPILLLAIAAPLALGLARRTSLLLPLLGLPGSLGKLTDIPLNLLHIVLSLGVRSSGPATLWLGHAPLLNAAELILGCLGVYYYLYLERSLRSLLLTACGVLAMVLVSFNASVGFACLVPMLYLLISGGLNHFLGEWLAVFPRNPIARIAGLAVVCAVLFFSVVYQVRSYFIAWPHTTATRAVFDVQRP